MVQHNPEVRLQVAPALDIRARGARAVQRHVPAAAQDKEDAARSARALEDL